MRWLMVLTLMALPAAAEEVCFAGVPKQVTYSDGRVITIIQRHGDDLTYTTPYEGFQDSVTKTHLMLFPKQGRAGARSSEYRWPSRLPGIEKMVPGFSFDLKGTMKSGGGAALPYRNEGQVTGLEEVKVGKCRYPALVIKVNTWLDDQLILTGTTWLSAEMMVVLKSETVPTSAGRQVSSVAVAVE